MHEETMVIDLSEFMQGLYFFRIDLEEKVELIRVFRY